jgi:hypothetical protein
MHESAGSRCVTALTPDELTEKGNDRYLSAMTQHAADWFARWLS